MNMKITSLVAGLVLVAGIGVAQAEVQLSSTQMDVVTAGYSEGKDYQKYHEPVVKPQTLSVAEAFADCSGSAKCFTDTSVIALVTQNAATSASFALASSGGIK